MSVGVISFALAGRVQAVSFISLSFCRATKQHKAATQHGHRMHPQSISIGQAPASII
jgi:hypothetical protein